MMKKILFFTAILLLLPIISYAQLRDSWEGGDLQMQEFSIRGGSNTGLRLDPDNDGIDETVVETDGSITMDEVNYTGTDGVANSVLITDGAGDTLFSNDLDLDSISSVTMTIDEVLSVSYARIINLSVSEDLSVYGNTVLGGKDNEVQLTIVGNENQSALLVNVTDATGTGLAQVWHTGHFQNIDGVRTVAPPMGPAIWTHNATDEEPLRTGGVGSYDHTGGVQEQLFTKTAGDDFISEDASIGNWILLSGINLGAVAEIKRLVSADSVIVSGVGWDGDLPSQTFEVFSHPLFMSGDLGNHEFSVSNSGEFEVFSYNFTGGKVAEIELDSAAAQTIGLEIEVKANGNTGAVASVVDYNTGTMGANDVGAGFVVRIDETAATDATISTLLASFVSQTTTNSDAVKTAFLAQAGHDSALVVQGSVEEDPDYGYETTSGVSVDRVNSAGGGDDAFLEASASNVTIFDSNGDDILIGSDATFEDIAVNLLVDSDKDLLPLFWYSQAGGNWTLLIVQGDGTNGFQQSGNIIFNAPPDWTKDDEDLDGNAITDAYYVAITRNRPGAVPVLPTEDHFHTFASQDTGMTIDGKGYILPRASSDSAAPNNAIYYSATQSALVYKDSNGVVNDLY